MSLRPQDGDVVTWLEGKGPVYTELNISLSDATSLSSPCSAAQPLIVAKPANPRTSFAIVRSIISFPSVGGYGTVGVRKLSRFASHSVRRGSLKHFVCSRQLAWSVDRAKKRAQDPPRKSV
jgi:hypothetical protein